MADPPRKVYWDACAWIGLINSEPKKLFSLRTIWEEAQRGKYELWTSVYIYMEVFKVLDRDGKLVSSEEALEKVEALLTQPYVLRTQVDTVIAKTARDLYIKYKPDGLESRPDAVHLATAVHHNLEEFHTWDKKHLLALDGKVARRDGEMLRIIQPGGDKVAGALFKNLPGSGLDHPSPGGGT